MKTKLIKICKIKGYINDTWEYLEHIENENSITVILFDKTSYDFECGSCVVKSYEIMKGECE